MKKIFILLTFLSTSAFSQVLPANAPERQQLIAMGAEILPEKKGDEVTIFKLGGDLFFIGKSSERTLLGRSFTREKSLNQVEELELFKLVNKFNNDYAFQFVVYDDLLQANLYIHGNHDPKVFASLLLATTRISSIFEANPRIFKLVNK